MYMGLGLNDYGTPVSMHICDTCGKAFTVCEAQDPDGHDYDNCLAETCESYDPARDIDKVWEGVQKFVERAPVPQPEEG